jgi:hypothetical protein
MEENVLCHCGQLVAKFRNGELYVWCKKCKTEKPILRSTLYPITKEMHDRYGCVYCADRITGRCPYSVCRYKNRLEKFNSYEDFFNSIEEY